MHKVLDFINGGSVTDLEEIVKCLRQLVEYHFKNLYPDHYSGKTKNLGDFINRIDHAKVGSPLHSLKTSSVLSELKTLNGYSRRFNHTDSKIPTRTEVSTYSKRILGLMGRA